MPDQPQDSGQPVPAPIGGEVERFNDPDGEDQYDMEKHPQGRWVRYEDYEKLKDRLDLAMAVLNMM